MVSSLGIRMHIHYANDLCGITEHPATYLAKKTSFGWFGEFFESFAGRRKDGRK